MMHVPANSAPASSLAHRNALASLTTALVWVASFVAVTTRRKRRNARSTLRSNPVNAQSGRMARKSTIPMKLKAYFFQSSARLMRTHHSTVYRNQMPTLTQKKNGAPYGNASVVSAAWSRRSTPMTAITARSIRSEKTDVSLIGCLPRLLVRR